MTPEAAIQSRIRDKLKAGGWLVVKLIQTSLNGIPDLMCIKNGHVIFLEVKAPGKKPRPLQSHVHTLLRYHDMPVHVVYSAEDVSFML